jgi:predicted nucleotidyltransferase
MATTALPPDFKDFLRSLNDHDVKYLLVGGYAVSYHGYVRGTADMDIWIAVEPDNAQRVLDAIIHFGHGTPDLSLAAVLTEETMLRMGLPPVRIEVLKRIAGVEFSDCYERRETAEIDGIMVPIIGKDDLIQNKLAAGRYKDLQDAKKLSRSRKPRT